MAPSSRPRCGQLEQRDLAFDGESRVVVEDGRLRGLIPYGVESRDLGGWREVIEPGALRGADMSDLIATVDHAGMPLGRHPGTLHVEERAEGLAWSVDLPESRADIREAVERGDVRSGSWRMIVKRDRWNGNVRRVLEIEALRDVSVAGASHAAYPAATVEFRTDNVPVGTNAWTPPPYERHRIPAGSLRVEERASEPPARNLFEEFRAAGFPGEKAVIDFDPRLFVEDRNLVWSGSLDGMNRQLQRPAADYGYDQRWVWPSVQSVGVPAGTTSVDVPTQTARSLATAASTVRTLASTATKPETGSTVAMVSSAMKQLATVASGIPNIYLEQPVLNSVIQQDLRLAINDALDKLVLDAIATSGFQAPGTDLLLVSVRKAITTMLAAGYNPDTLWLTPAAAEALDLLVSGEPGVPSTTTATATFVFGPGNFSSDVLFRLNKRISKSLPASVVVDSRALGKLYVSPVSLARFEENAGSTNTSTLRLETTGVFGSERTAAAIRIAAS